MSSPLPLHPPDTRATDRATLPGGQRAILTNLEAARFVAAFAVLLWHYQHFSYMGTTWILSDYSQQPYFSLLKPFFLYGQAGVQFFWMLSGYIFFATYSSRVEQRRVGAQAFALNRFTRLYPLHLVTMLTVFALQAVYRSIAHSDYVYVHNSAGDLLKGLVMGNWDPAEEALNGPAWSVSLEVLAYITFFLALRWIPKGKWLTALGVPGVLVLSAFWFRTHVIAAMFTLFYSGGFLYLLGGQIDRLPVHRSVVRPLAATLAVAGLLALVVTGAGNDMLLAGEFGLVLFALVQLPQLRGRAGRVAQILGNTTYASYLMHFPLQLVIAIGFAWLARPIPWQGHLLLPLWIAAVYLVSFPVYRYFERPVQDALRAGRLSFGSWRVPAVIRRPSLP